LEKYRLLQGDIIFGRKGAVDRRAYVEVNEENWIQGSDCIRLRLEISHLDSKFISYVLGSQAYVEWITRNAQGATMPSLNQKIIRRVPIPLPPLSQQRAIAHILGGLDDKIELNRQMNRTLEAMARAIFKAWFVDFDPVRTKQDGQPPAGMDADTAALFPASFVESVLGPVPEGWRVCDLPEVIEANPSRSLSKSQLAPYLEMKNMPTDLARPLEWQDREYKSGMRFINGDVLLARITPCLENGKTAYVDFLEDEQVGWGIIDPKK
jgi:type I restriction enzyme S subunit